MRPHAPGHQEAGPPVPARTDRHTCISMWSLLRCSGCKFEVIQFALNADPEYIQSYEDYESNRALQDPNARFAGLLLTSDDLWLVGTLEV